MYYLFDLTDLTKEEQAEAKRISDEVINRVQELTQKAKEAREAGKDASKINAELLSITENDPYLLYLEQIEKRHFSLFNGNLSAIYDDAIERLPRLIKRNYNSLLAFLRNHEEQNEAFKQQGKQPLNEFTETEKEAFLSPESLIGRLKYNLSMYLEALQKDSALYEKLITEIETQVKAYRASHDIDDIQDPAQLSYDIVPAYYGSVLDGRSIMPSFHTPTADTIFNVTSNIIKNNIDPIAHGRSKFDIQGVKFDLENPPKNWGLNEKMLLLIGMAQLTVQNAPKVTPKNTKVSIPLKGYGEFRNIHVTADIMETEEEQEKENKRVSNNLKNLRRAVRANLENMMVFKFKGPNGTGGAYAFLTKYWVANDTIEMEFNPEYVEKLVKGYIEYIPVSIGKIPTKNQNSDSIFSLALAFLHRYTNFNNHSRANVDPEILSVKKAIEHMNITTYKDLEKRKDTRHWQREIKDKLDDALETLHSIGFLGDYRYCKAKGAELTDAEYDEMLTAGYQAFEKLNIKFKIKDNVVFRDQINKWEEKTKKNIEANRKKAANRKKT